MPRFDVDALRAEFPALAREQDGRPVAFLDGPGGTQVPQRVIDAVVGYYRDSNANSGGAFTTSQRSDAIVDEAHAAVADFLGAASPDEIKFGQNMSSLTLHLGRSIGATLGPGDEIVVTTLDHEANVSTWRAMAADRGVTVHTVDIDPTDVTLDLEDLESKLSSRTKLVAVGYASNAVGTVNPVRDIVARAHEVGALTFVDAVAYAPHGPIDVAGPRHGLPGLLGLQVVRAAPGRAVREEPPSSTACRSSRSGPRTTAGRPGRSRSRRSPGRSPRPTTCATSGATTATWPGRREPRTPANGAASSSRRWSPSPTTSATWSAGSSPDSRRSRA